MQLTVFGATGGTGRHVVRQALAAGHRVTAVVRDPARLPVPAQDGLTVVTAQLDDRAAVLGAVEGADAVVDALGPSASGPSTIMTDAARTITAAMREADVSRLVVISASGAHTTGDSLPIRLLVKPVLQRVLRHAFADMRAMEDVVRESELDWTIVLPPRLTDKPRTGAVRTRVGANVRGSFSITRADLATAVLAAATDRALRGASLSVAAG
ncbi:NAD(P)-dependent oxidoreductase [Pseudonocardia nigra]|uniref:NAD(P)-dependent oxidoreductase n=1 Tax=Pseudonocardia nigra TaxID=1921578 RepID=UPI001C5E3AC5|nr:NAD(P)H-binding protein [Pseudonocardia nigra]